MTRLLKQAWVIARRDFRATVVSRSFVLFLLGPLLALGFGATIGRVADSSDKAALRPQLIVLAKGYDATRLTERYTRIEGAVANGALPEMIVHPPTTGPEKLAGERSAVLDGWPYRPQLIGSAGALDATRGLANLLARGEGGGATQTLVEARIAPPPSAADGGGEGRHLMARAAQTLLFMLTILLAGMLLSNLVEEKSNKVIEVLASAVPVDAIFWGKLIAMLGVSLTGIVVWGSVLAAGAAMLLPPGGSLPLPAVGWPVFILLGALYYVMNYLILGGVFLGLGAQASSVREVQTLSMPATMAQLALFALASTAVGDLARPVVLISSVFPLSSPLTMIARAAQDGALWPHLLALVWQGIWVAVIVRFAARRFRVGVLKSGPQKSK
ncbi:ABC transporter permease [Sphingomonas antarctica]|uniref:ABC transporter permease n=1 Tax=Sphingomonas antarctica TaxID=2040274 RepID=UPI0039ED5614